MTDPTASLPKPEARRGRFIVFGVLSVLVAGLLGARAIEHRGQTTGATATTADAGSSAPTGAFTTTTGRTMNLASYVGGHTTMVWFVVTGCASCAASVPAVAQHLDQLAHDHVQVVVLDLYGDVGSGAGATSDFAQFGNAVAGSDYANPTWTWGLASSALSYAYDPSGIPDEYFLVAANGRVYYQNSVPVTTMQELLAEAGRSDL